MAFYYGIHNVAQYLMSAFRVKRTLRGRGGMIANSP